MEKKANIRKQQELEEIEAEMVRRYAQQQEARETEIRAQKAKAEAEREEIFKKLAIEEERRRAEQEYIENLRNEL